MKKRPVPITAIIVFAIGAISAFCHYRMYRSSEFADFFNSTVGFFYRRVISKITGILPISLAEFLLYTSPFIVIVIIVAICRYAARENSRLIRAICFLLCIPTLVYSMFVAGLAPGYRGAPFEEKLGIEKAGVSADDLYNTQMIIITELNKLSSEISYDMDGASVMPYGIGELSDKLCVSYDCVSKQYTFINSFNSQVKPLIISKYMTYTHLSGLYTFFTGEANINTNYPDYIIAYSAAHEMAHQRGISKEDEANFTAFLVCKNSDDVFLRYSAYLNMYEYISSALYEADKTLFAAAYYTLNASVSGDLKAYSDFFEKYRENKAADVSDKLNNSYLESQGTAGVKSYGMVVDLAVAYYKK